VGWVVPLHRQGAVARNRLKRRLREIARLELLPRLDDRDIPQDVIVRTRREAYDVDYATLRDELVTWLERRWPREPRSA
jgi:ribonuclease P protein component